MKTLLGQGLTISRVTVAAAILFTMTAFSPEARAANPNFDAVVTRVSIPDRIEIGKTARVSVTVTNEGYADWRNHDVKLMSQIVAGPSGRGQNIPELLHFPTAKEGRNSGETWTFQYDVKGPDTPGDYEMEWSMALKSANFGKCMRHKFEVFGTNQAAEIHEGDIKYSPNPVQPGKKFSVSVLVTDTGDVPFKVYNPTLKMSVVKKPSGSNSACIEKVFNTRFFKPDGKKWTFEQSLVAPTQEGAYAIRWQMCDGSTTIGDSAQKTLNVVVK